VAAQRTLTALDWPPLLGNGTNAPDENPADKTSIRTINVGVYYMGAGNMEDPPMAVVLVIRLQRMILSEDDVGQH
jgi:hypothetical protein